MPTYDELTAFFHYAPIAQIVVDKNFCFREVNDSLCELIGYRREEILLKPYYGFSHPDDSSAMIAFARRILERPLRSATIDARYVRRDGLIIDVHITGVVLRDSERFICHIVDRSSTQIVKRDLALMESVVLNTADAILIGAADPPAGQIHGRPILFGNDSFTRMTGYTYEEYVGKTTELLFGPETSMEQLKPVFEDMVHGRPQHFETVLYRKDGTKFHAEVNATPVVDDDKVINWVLVIRDITERIEYIRKLTAERDRAEAASRAKTDFLANMSHELRTPLNAIIGYSEVMKEQLFGPLGIERYVTYAQDIHLSGHHLLEIINDLLDMAKIEAGKLDLEEAVCSLHEICEGSLLFVSARAEKKQLVLRHVNETSDPIYVYGDRRAIRQMLINLLSNAVKFTKDGGEVAIGADLTADHVRIFVRDTGIGMDPHFISRIGTKFLQAEAVAIKTFEGTGLGLSLVKELIEMHDGQLVVDSVKGEGTTASVLLPRHRLRDAPS